MTCPVGFLKLFTRPMAAFTFSSALSQKKANSARLPHHTVRISRIKKATKEPELLRSHLWKISLLQPSSFITLNKNLKTMNIWLHQGNCTFRYFLSCIYKLPFLSLRTWFIISVRNDKTFSFWRMHHIWHFRV